MNKIGVGFILSATLGFFPHHFIHSLTAIPRSKCFWIAHYRHVVQAHSFPVSVQWGQRIPALACFRAAEDQHETRRGEGRVSMEPA